MTGSKLIRGFYGSTNGKSIEGDVRLVFFSRGLNETLSVEFTGICRLDFAYRPLEQFIRKARAELVKGGSEREKAGEIRGQYSDSRIKLDRGRIMVWYRGGSMVETLSMSFEDGGQLTIPLAPMLGLVSAERATRA